MLPKFLRQAATQNATKLFCFGELGQFNTEEWFDGSGRIWTPTRSRTGRLKRDFWLLSLLLFLVIAIFVILGIWLWKPPLTFCLGIPPLDIFSGTAILNICATLYLHSAPGVKCMMSSYVIVLCWVVCTFAALKHWSVINTYGILRWHRHSAERKA